MATYSLKTKTREDKFGLAYERGIRVDTPKGPGVVTDPSLLGRTYGVRLDSGGEEEFDAKQLEVSMKAWDRGYSDGRTGKAKSLQREGARVENAHGAGYWIVVDSYPAKLYWSFNGGLSSNDADAEVFGSRQEAEAEIRIRKSQPSDDIDPDKARQILEDGEIDGEPLTEAQRGMFGAAAGRDKALNWQTVAGSSIATSSDGRKLTVRRVGGPGTEFVLKVDGTEIGRFSTRQEAEQDAQRRDDLPGQKTIDNNPYDDLRDPQKYQDWSEGFKDGRAGVQDAGGSKEYKEGVKASENRQKAEDDYSDGYDRGLHERMAELSYKRKCGVT